MMITTHTCKKKKTCSNLNSNVTIDFFKLYHNNLSIEKVQKLLKNENLHLKNLTIEEMRLFLYHLDLGPFDEIFQEQLKPFEKIEHLIIQLEIFVRSFLFLLETNEFRYVLLYNVISYLGKYVSYIFYIVHMIDIAVGFLIFYT